MLTLSAVLHIVVFLIIIFIPGAIRSQGRFTGTVYEVNLVEMPSKKALNNQKAATVAEMKEKVTTVKKSQAKRIPPPKIEKKPLIIAKRTVKRKSTKIEEPKVSPSQLIDKAISKIEKKVKSENEDRVESAMVEKAISELKKKVETKQTTGTPGPGRALDGIPIRIYQMEVETWIKSNWSYPVAIQDRDKLEAIVLLTVKQDGTILKSTFKKRSSDVIFDQSVERAIEKSDPLPPFPEGYRKNHEEFEINFNLKDLDES